MPAIPTSNNGSTFFNINDCRTFKQTITTSLVALTSYPCSEVIVVNKTGANVAIFDNNNSALGNAFLLSNNESFTFRGITSTAMVSASGAVTGDIYYRTQYFSLLPQR